MVTVVHQSGVEREQYKNTVRKKNYEMGNNGWEPWVFGVLVCCGGCCFMGGFCLWFGFEVGPQIKKRPQTKDPTLSTSLFLRGGK